ncbi:MAG: hypothetical protein O3A25_20000 [Acidobacteria bacterium]|nr:hypothetical protein [Acidobacteriota bacterium]
MGCIHAADDADEAICRRRRPAGGGPRAGRRRPHLRELRPLNVNADTVAAAVASAVGAWRLVFLSDVHGIRDREGRWHQRLRAERLRTWLADGTLDGGMLPKGRGALHALMGGVGGVLVTDGSRPTPLLSALGLPPAAPSPAVGRLTA